MASQCVGFEELIDREAHGWSEAERLRVEHHLNDCEDCRSTLKLSRVVREAVESTSGSLSEASVERALTRAFAASADAPRKHHSTNVKRLVMASSALALAAAAALLLWTTRTSELASRPPLVGPGASSQKAEPVVAPTPAESPWIETTESEVRAFAHASVRLSAQARVRFDDQTNDLELARGSVEVSVDPRPHRPFRVTTQRFRVEVLGTRFIVDDVSVTVLEGRVRVFDLEGEILANELAAGARFSYEAQEAAFDAQEAELEEHGSKTAARDHVTVSAAAWLTRARGALAKGDLDETRKLIVRAQASHPRRHDKAEALTLRAELALVEREPAQAIRFYERVARQYGDLAAGETGAFAAAQIAARSGSTRARILFTNYLTRYPSGRFSEEAKKRLATLKSQ